MFDLGLDTGQTPAAPAGAVLAGQAVVTGTASQVLWQVLTDADARSAFAAMVLARCVEPGLEAGHDRHPEQVEGAGTPAQHLAAALNRATYRDTLTSACREHSVRTAGKSALVL